MTRLLHLFLITIISLSLHAMPVGGDDVFTTHRVQAGETLASIAAQYGLTQQQIKDLNPRVNQYFFAGMELTLPLPEPTEPEEAPQPSTVSTPKASTPKTSAPKDSAPKASKSKDKSSRSKSDVHKAPGPKPFEGQLNYVGHAYANAAAITSSNGLFFNGPRTLSVIIRGDQLHYTDHTLHIHTILLPQSDIAYFYSDVTKRGIRMTYQAFVEAAERLIIPEGITSDPKARHQRMNVTGEQRKHAGQECTVMNGIYLTPELRTQVDLWSSRSYSTEAPISQLLLRGVITEGIPARYVLETNSTSSVLKPISHGISMQIEEINKRSVLDKEFLPDADIQFSETEDPRRLIEIIANNTSHLRKAEMYPVDADIETSLRFPIEEQWPF